MCYILLVTVFEGKNIYIYKHKAISVRKNDKLKNQVTESIWILSVLPRTCSSSCFRVEILSAYLEARYEDISLFW